MGKHANPCNGVALCTVHTYHIPSQRSLFLFDSAGLGGNVGAKEEVEEQDQNHSHVPIVEEPTKHAEWILRGGSTKDMQHGH